jgi:hypothetical protein
VNRSQLLRLSRGAIAPVISASALLIVIAGLASDRAFAASTLGVGCGAGSFPTIQGAVDAAGAGDTVQVCAGSYAEQVTIPAAKTGLTLRSQPAAAATIQAPASLPPTQSSALVHVDGATGVTIDGFMISGPGTGSCGTIGYGVLVDGGGSATVSSNHVADIRDSSLSGCQSGVGVAAGCCLTGPASSGTLVATGNTIDGYQKSGIDIRGAGSAGTLTRNIIRGAGPTTRIAQNAIQISRSASATVTGNTISGSVFAPQPLATGIVAIGPVGNLAIAGNILVGNDYGIWVFNASATTTVSGNATTAGFYGIVVGLSRNVLVEKNLSDRAATAGIRAAEDASGNTFRNNVATGGRPAGPRLPRRVDGLAHRGHGQHLDEQRRRHAQPGGDLLLAAGDRGPAPGDRDSAERRAGAGRAARGGGRRQGHHAHAQKQAALVRDRGPDARPVARARCPRGRARAGEGDGQAGRSDPRQAEG